MKRQRSRAGDGDVGNAVAGDDATLARGEDVAALPVVALVGRPNTGKSTLFNRLTHSRRALVASQPGVTRDRNIGVTEHDGRRFLLIDTGGFEEEEEQEIGRAVRQQAIVAAAEADAVVIVVDGRSGLNAHDTGLLQRLRGLSCPRFVAVNKIDTARHEDLAAEFYALGVDEVHAVSAEHGLGVDDLMSEVMRALPAPEDAGPEPAEEAGQPMTAVAIIGRPNVGKSSLVNRLAGYQRSIVTDVPGTTRDPLDTPVTHQGRRYLLVDTAGIRRRPKVHEHIERASVVRAFRAIERSHVALLVVDAVEGLTEQDARVAGYAWERGRALVLLVNKWDAVAKGERDRDAFCERAESRFPSLKVVPRLFISALTGSGTQKIWAAVDGVATAHRLRMSTPEVNEVLQNAIRRQAPPLVRGRRPRMHYATQTATAPPTLMIFGAAGAKVNPTYRRYLISRFREAFPLEGTPLRLIFRPRKRSAS